MGSVKNSLMGMTSAVLTNVFASGETSISFKESRSKLVFLEMVFTSSRRTFDGLDSCMPRHKMAITPRTAADAQKSDRLAMLGRYRSQTFKRLTSHVLKERRRLQWAVPLQGPEWMMPTICESPRFSLLNQTCSFGCTVSDWQMLLLQ